MKKTWYQEIYNSVENSIKFRIPVEIVHFPSTGITSAINKYAQILKVEDEHIRYLIVDLDAARFGDDPERNRYEFFRTVRSHLEQQLGNIIDQRPDQSIYAILEKILQEFIEQKIRIYIVLETTARLALENVPEFWDLLIFIDRLRDRTEGAINIVVTSTYPLFNDVHPSPIPMITRYFNYYDQGRLYRTVNEDIFLKKLPNKEVLNVIEQCHGLVAVIKSLKLDMDILGKKIEDIDFKNINQEFFDTFISTKQALDRIRNKSNQGAMNTYLKLSQQEQLTESDAIHLSYLKKIGLVSEDNKLKGSILSAYLKLYLKKAVNEPKLEPVQLTQKIAEPKVKDQIESLSRFNPSEFYLINDHIQINKSTGEIFFKHKISAEYLTEKELIVFKTLYESINHNVSKEILGNHIWGQESDQYYSEWAIDKLVSRIREKIDDIKPFKVIKTIRNKGYCLISNTKLEE